MKRRELFLLPKNARQKIALEFHEEIMYYAIKLKGDQRFIISKYDCLSKGGSDLISHT